MAQPTPLSTPIAWDDLDPLLEELHRRAERSNGGRGTTLREWTDLTEAWWICRALTRCRGNRSAAARALGIGRRTLYAKLERYGIEPSWRAGATLPK